MGGALLSRWVKLDAVEITVLDPGDPKLPDGVTRVSNPSELGASRFDALVVAVKPQLIPAAVPEAAKYLSDDGCVISIAAGTSAESLSKHCGGAPIIRLMPNMPARIGMGVSGLYAEPSCTEAHRTLADRLATAAGAAIWLEAETAIDRITAAAGSGPGYVYEFARAYQDAVEALGFSATDAKALVRETILGSLTLAQDGDDSFEALRDSIMSKGGTTAAGVSALNADGELGRRVRKAVTAAYGRAVELRA
jgi:pyrroline-5-carboxylate reductase